MTDLTPFERVVTLQIGIERLLAELRSVRDQIDADADSDSAALRTLVGDALDNAGHALWLAAQDTLDDLDHAYQVMLSAIREEVAR